MCCQWIVRINNLNTTFSLREPYFLFLQISSGITSIDQINICESEAVFDNLWQYSVQKWYYS